jgi:mono/diheme cytochrome c family protein
MSETCIECHEIDEFEGMSAEEIATATTEANANSKQMAKATADLSAEDLQAIIDYIAAEANK